MNRCWNFQHQTGRYGAVDAGLITPGKAGLLHVLCGAAARPTEPSMRCAVPHVRGDDQSAVFNVVQGIQLALWRIIWVE
ncbi:MAG: hypothetical protein GDA36_11095 [Rhodobacteraceae bacterium]|nr:hypothetical protein [Paracoccaceae bacterium]